VSKVKGKPPPGPKHEGLSAGRWEILHAYKQKGGPGEDRPQYEQDRRASRRSEKGTGQTRPAEWTKETRSQGGQSQAAETSVGARNSTGGKQSSRGPLKPSLGGSTRKPKNSAPDPETSSSQVRGPVPSGGSPHSQLRKAD